MRHAYLGGTHLKWLLKTTQHTCIKCILLLTGSHMTCKVFFLAFLRTPTIQRKLSRVTRRRIKSETSRQTELETSNHGFFLLSLASRRRLKHYFVFFPCCNPANTAKPFTKEYMEDTYIHRDAVCSHRVYLVRLSRFLF